TLARPDKLPKNRPDDTSFYAERTITCVIPAPHSLDGTTVEAKLRVGQADQRILMRTEELDARVQIPAGMPSGKIQVVLVMSRLRLQQRSVELPQFRVQQGRDAGEALT